MPGPLLNLDHAPNGLLRLLLPAAAIVAAALAIVAVLDRLARNEQAAERRALIERHAQLTMGALAPGSALACLNGGTGETVETACEAAVFAGPRSTAAAVAYTAARLTLLADAQAYARREDDKAVLEAFAADRRAAELDRFGIAAHVLAVRDGCTANQCPAFALFGDVNALKANLKAQVFDQYVSRHAPAWNAPAADDKPPPAAMSAAPAMPVPPQAEAGRVARPLSSKYDFPSAASIPPVSIMNAEPALPKPETDAQAAQPDAEPGAAPKAEAESLVPVPAKRPQPR